MKSNSERKIKEFRRFILSEVEFASFFSEAKSPHERFTEIVCNIISENGEFSDVQKVYYEGKIGKTDFQFDSYVLTEEEKKIHLVTTFYDGGENLSLLNVNEVSQRLKSCQLFLERIGDIKRRNLENAEGQKDFVDDIAKSLSTANSVKIHLLSDQKVKELDWNSNLKKVEISAEIWDIQKLSSLNLSSSLDIQISDLSYEEKILCLNATSGYRHKKGKYQTYLTVFPGEVLADLYEKYSTRLLEKNVRSFLSSKGKINKGIRTTIHEEPERFLAYNNGISLTATDIKISSKKHLEYLSGMQIVNGGQTVASLHQAKYLENISLDGIQVKASINVIDHGYEEEMVPRISEYSNTQNAIKSTDLTSNHKFHIEIEKMSRSIVMPRGKPKWFYERSNGEYEVVRGKAERNGEEALETFLSSFPKENKILKTDLARCMMLCDGKPHIADKGPASSFEPFMKEIDNRGPDWLPDDEYYKDSIVKWIIYKEVMSIAKIKLKGRQYTVDAVIYLVAYIFNLLNKQIDSKLIWKEQTISEPFKKQIEQWLPVIHDSLFQEAEAAGGVIKEFFKKETCWLFIQNQTYDFNEDFKEELGNELPKRTRAQTAALKQSRKDREIVSQVMSMTSEEIIKIHQKLLPVRDSLKWPPITDVIWTLAGQANNRWEKQPTIKQSQKMLEAVELADLY